MNKKELVTLLLLMALWPLSMLNAETLKEQAEAKITALEALMTQAENSSLDTEREALAVWVATEFLKYADWDAENTAVNEREFGKYGGYSAQKTQMATDLPDFERQEVIDMLDAAIVELTAVINGTVVRRPAVLVDWENVSVDDDQFTSGGKPVFLYDYFSKSHDTSTDDLTVYNDYMGDIDHPSGLNNHYLTEDMEFVSWRLDEIVDHPSTRIGYTMLWHKGDPTWQNSIPEVDNGTSLFITYDIDNPTMRAVWDTTLKHVAAEIKDKKYIDMGYILANEPHWFSEEDFWTYDQGEMTSISSYTLQKFIDWLKVKYNDDIVALDNSWKTIYSLQGNGFDAITWTMPVPKLYKGTAKWYDWCRFNMERGTEWFEFLQDAIHYSDPDADTHLKIMTDVFAEEDRHHGIDLEAVTELTTFIGDDAKARGREYSTTSAEDWEASYAYYWEELAVSYDFMESVAPDKIHVNSESHFISTSHWRDLEMEPSYVRNVYWLATILGMDGNLTWFWPRNPDGSIEERFTNGSYTEDSYPGSAAMQPRVVNEYAKVMMDMNAFSEEIMKLRRLEKPIRIFYSETSVINGDEQMQHYFDLYESMFFNGLPLGYATKNIIEKQHNSTWQVIVVYKTESVTDEEFDALQTYLNNGGTVIIDNSRSLIKNEYGETRTASLVKSNGTLYELGASATLSQMRSKVNEVIQAKGKNPVVEIAETNGTARQGCMWRVAKESDLSYLVTIVNVGKTSADLTLSLHDGATATSVENMLTGEELGTTFSLASEGVLLLKVGVPVSIEATMAEMGVSFISGDEQLTIEGARGEEVTIYNVDGIELASQTINSDSETIKLPSGIVLVKVEGVGTIKAIVR